ncbi:WD40 repeat-like protein, partial [Ceratobasidium sp. AG-I]
THIHKLVPVLRTLHCGQTLGEHVAQVKDLQFSPDGQFLITCSWDKTVLVWRVESDASGRFSVTHKLEHRSLTGGFVSQVAWNPNGEQLLTRQARVVKLWNAKTGGCEKTINRKRNVHSVIWMP